MSDHSPHPTREELSAYSLGLLPQERAVAIDSHISECQPCCETIVGIAPDDTFVDLLQEARHLPTDQTLDHAVATVFSSGQENPDQLADHPRYEVLGLIGKGGMGDVYKARHRKMERTVALKVINRQLVQKPEAVDRFHREVKAAAQLSHPNIVTAYDADQAGYFHFMVMEHVDGVNLSQTVKDRGALPVAEACGYIRQAAIGLQHAHDRGMVHRDIKPHNLMVTKDGTVKILDFGLASLAPETVLDPDAVEARGDLTAAGAIMGTPDFISPEQATDARTADIRSDIYSLGATLYFLLSGRPPFAEGSVMQKIRSHAQFEPEPIESYRNDVPPELVAVATKMTAKNPDDRFQTPAEVAGALESFCRSVEPQKAVETPTPAESRRWPPRFPSSIAVAALFVAIFAGFAYILQTGDGVLSLRRVPHEDRSTIGSHPLSIIDTSGKKPLGGTSGTHQDDAAGITSYSFESANGRYKITLVDEILTVNGERYSLDNPTDSIRIVDDRVEITRVVAVPQAGEPLDRAKLLVGEWRGTTDEDEVVRVTFDSNGAFEMLVADPPRLKQSSTRRIGRFTVDFSVSPAQLDLYAAVNPAAKPRNSGDDSSEASTQVDDQKLEINETQKLMTIIELVDANTLHMAEPNPDSRPETFQDKLVALQRQELPENQDESQSDEAAIQGQWRVILAEDSGRTGPPEALRDIRMVITQDTLIMEVAGQKSISTYKLAPSTSPRSIDLTQNGRRKLGIYDLQGDTLRICFSEGKDKRPTAFDSQPDSVNDVVLTLKRVSPDMASGANAVELNHEGPLSEELARSLISEAASISNEDFQTLQTEASAESIENQSLSLVLMALETNDQSVESASDFRFLIEGHPKPSELAAAMSPSRSRGYVSIIQPDYITECKLTTSTDDTAQGKVTFNAPRLYIGSVAFEARKHEGKWRIEKFQLLARRVSVALGDDGIWRRESKSEDAVGD